MSGSDTAAAARVTPWNPTVHNSVYFDAATATPPHPVARDALLAALDDGWADPARLYTSARRARQLLDAARAAVADALRVRADEVSFCASGTQAARMAVAGLLTAERGGASAGGAERGGASRQGTSGQGASGQGASTAGASGSGRLVHSAIEHSAVLHAADEHRAAGGAVDVVPVDRLGRLEMGAWRAAVNAPGVTAAALIAASHEVGTLQPVSAAAEACREAGVPLYVDAAQSLPWGPLPSGWSVCTGSAHKWGGYPGVGLLVVRKGTRWPHRPAADGREEGRVPGPPNLPAIVAAAAALRATRADVIAEAKRLSALVDRIRITVATTVPDIEVVGDPLDRLPHMVTFSCLYVDGEALLHALDRRGFAVSSGSSCTSSTLRPSHVLEAMGVLSHGNIRISLHRGTTSEDVDRFLAELPMVVARLRDEAGVGGL